MGYLLFVNIENGRPSPPLNSYVYISYQAKHPFNFSNIKEDNHKYQSANFSDIQDLYNLTRYCDYTLCNTQSISCASTLLPYLPQASDMHLEGRNTSLSTGTSTGIIICSSTSTGTSTSTQLPFLEQTLAGARCIRWAGCTVLETEWCHMGSLQPWQPYVHDIVSWILRVLQKTSRPKMCVTVNSESNIECGKRVQELATSPSVDTKPRNTLWFLGGKIHLRLNLFHHLGKYIALLRGR